MMLEYMNCNSFGISLHVSGNYGNKTAPSDYCHNQVGSVNSQYRMLSSRLNMASEGLT